jgi:hypothetical protein
VKTENPDRAQNTDFSSYRILVGTEEIGRLAGSKSNVTLWCSGEMKPDLWHPENVPSLVRAVLPVQTEGLSDKQIMKGAEMRVVGTGKAVSQAVTSREEGPNGRVPLDWNLQSAKDLERFGELLRSGDATFSIFRVERTIEGVHGAISYVAGRSEPDAHGIGVGSQSGGISIHHDPEFPWGKETIGFFMEHNVSSTVRDMDCALLAERISDTSRVIAGIATPEQALD